MAGKVSGLEAGTERTVIHAKPELMSQQNECAAFEKNFLSGLQNDSEHDSIYGERSTVSADVPQENTDALPKDASALVDRSLIKAVSITEENSNE